MKITIHDTLTAMRELLAAPLPRRPELLRDILTPIAAAYPGGPDADQVELHHAGNGFRVDRDDPRYPAALDALDRADAWGQVERGLAEALARQRSAIPHIRLVNELHVVLLLGDPSDTFFVDVTGGYYGMGGIPGSLFLVVWPTGHSEHRVGYCAVHEFHHNVRYTSLTWNPATVTVAEQVVAEGLAEAFVREIYGPSALHPYADPARGDEHAYATVLAHLHERGMANLTAYVHGDATAIRMGRTPVGLPTGAGYAAGLRIVDDHLAATGLTAAASTLLPAADIIENANHGDDGAVNHHARADVAP